MEDIKETCLFLRAAEFCPTFDIRISIALVIFGKSCKTTLFRKPTGVSQNTPAFISLEAPITKQRSFKNENNVCYFGGSFFKMKIADILDF